MYLSKEQVREKRWAVIHNAPFIIGMFCIPTIWGSAAMMDGSLPAFVQIPLFFVSTMACMEAFRFVADKLFVDITVEGSDDYDVPRGKVLRAGLAIPLFFFGMVMANPMTAMWWSGGLGIIVSAAFFYFVKFLPAE